MKSQTKIWLGLYSIIVLACLGGFTQAAVSRLRYDGRAYIREDSPDLPSYSSTILYLSGTPGMRRIAFLSFDFRDQDAPRLSYLKAELVITIQNDTTITENIVIKIYNGTDSSWSSSTLTWNNAPPIGPKLGEITVTPDELPELNRPILKYLDLTPIYTGNNSLLRFRDTITFVFLIEEDAEIYIQTSVIVNINEIPHILYTVEDGIPSYYGTIILGLIGLLSVVLYRKVNKIRNSI